MKKIALAASLAATGFAFTAFVTPKLSRDNDFEGIITYSVTVEGNPQAASMMTGSSMKVYIKGDKSKTLMDMGMSKQIIFTDRKTPDDPIVLVEMMGNKYQIKDIDSKKDEQGPDIKYVDGTKEIAGYTCKKAQVTSTSATGESATSDIYYTDELPAYEGKGRQFKGLKGCPLEFSFSKQGMTFTMIATSVKKQSVPDKTFVVPSGYKLMTQAELMQDIQKNMSGGGEGN